MRRADGRRSDAVHAVAARTSAPNATAFQVDVDAGKQWVDTKIDLRTGEKLKITATGTITYPADKKHPDGKTFGPDGLDRSFKDLIHEYAVADGGHGALIGRLGGADAGGQPFLVGAADDYQAPVAGRLFLGINQSYKDAQGAKGSFHMTISVTDPGAAPVATIAAGGPAETTIPGITPALLEKIPRRVTDPQGNPGDMVNILIVGTQAIWCGRSRRRAGCRWIVRCRTRCWRGSRIRSRKKDYLTMPMSTLFLFNRPQDYGFAHAEPVRVAMSRNHLRVWKSAYTVGWPAAVVHRRDARYRFRARPAQQLGVTHKIDPAIDGEREYVNDTLSETGLVARAIT